MLGDGGCHLSFGSFLRRQVIDPRVFQIAFKYISEFGEISALLYRHLSSFGLVLISFIKLHLEARVELVINTVRIVLVNPRCLCI